MTPYVDFYNDGNVEILFEEYKEKAEKVGLEYPVIVKILTASRHKYAHSFYIANNDEGMKVALGFEGYKGT